MVHRRASRSACRLQKALAPTGVEFLPETETEGPGPRVRKGIVRKFGFQIDGQWGLRNSSCGFPDLVQDSGGKCCLVLWQEPTIMLGHHFRRVLDRVACLFVGARLLQDMGG